MLNEHKNITVESLNNQIKNTMASHLGMEVIEIGKAYLIIKMPVDERTIQSIGILNGGASMALAETTASMAANLLLKDGKVCVGIDINGNHIKSVNSGFVYAKAVPLHLGNRTHVWEINIKDENDNLICVARFTAAIIEKPQ